MRRRAFLPPRPAFTSKYVLRPIPILAANFIEEPDGSRVLLTPACSHRHMRLFSALLFEHWTM